MIKEKTVEILEPSHRSKQQRKEKRNEPYWNVKRVVLTGWLLRYPGNFFAVVNTPYTFYWELWWFSYIMQGVKISWKVQVITSMLRIKYYIVI